MSFLELRQVEYCYSKKRDPVVTDINLKLDQKTITALVGPNGSGKTTLTRLMIGVLQPVKGDIYLAGRPLKDYTLAQVGGLIGYVFQNPDLQLFCSSVADEIAFGLTRSGHDPQIIREKVDYYLDYFELSKYRGAFPLHLSQGEKQRLAIAAVLAHEPDYLILDEPTIGLDVYRKRLLADHLRKAAASGRGMLLVSHDLAFVDKLADRVITIENGRIQSEHERKGIGICS